MKSCIFNFSNFLHVNFFFPIIFYYNLLDIKNSSNYEMSSQSISMKSADLKKSFCYFFKLI